jgi:uncharacterized protein (TIGR02757 family)
MSADMPTRAIKRRLDELYDTYTRREFVPPDPVEALYPYGDVRDREIVALIASSLAYGRAAQIHKSVSAVLGRMAHDSSASRHDSSASRHDPQTTTGFTTSRGVSAPLSGRGPTGAAGCETTPSPGSPRRFLERSSLESLRHAFADFRHRFTSGEELAVMLFGVRRVLDRWGSLEACFAAGISADDDTVLPALCRFVRELTTAADGDAAPRACGEPCPDECPSLLPLPARGSACKRLNLFLRWMVRRDDVDPGGWDGVPPAKLIVPLDTHMHRICLTLSLTRRRHPDMRAALEATSAFRQVAPDDPVRYDFALTRLGIRTDTDWHGFVEACRRARARAVPSACRRGPVLEVAQR